MSCSNTSDLCFRSAEINNLNDIMVIVNQAKHQLKALNIDQWQDGYPNSKSISHDIELHNGYCLSDKATITAYAAIVFTGEPTYAQIDGTWLSNKNYVVVHRICVADEYKHQGIAEIMLLKAQEMAIQRGFDSFRIDTHKDNIFMQKIIRKLGFTYCGIIKVRDGNRLAFEKIL